MSNPVAPNSLNTLRPLSIAFLTLDIPEPPPPPEPQVDAMQGPPDIPIADDYLSPQRVRMRPLVGAWVLVVPPAHVSRDPWLFITDQEGALCRITESEIGGMDYRAVEQGTFRGTYDQKRFVHFGDGETYPYSYTLSPVVFRELLAAYRKPGGQAMKDHLFSSFQVRHVDRFEMERSIEGTFDLLPDDQRPMLAFLLHNVGNGAAGYVTQNNFRPGLYPPLESADPAHSYVFARRPAISAVYLAEFLVRYASSIKRRAAWDFSVLQQSIDIGRKIHDEAPRGTRTPEFEPQRRAWAHLERSDEALREYTYACAASRDIAPGDFHGTFRMFGSSLATNYPLEDALKIYRDHALRFPAIPAGVTAKALFPADFTADAERKAMIAARALLVEAVPLYPQPSVNRWLGKFAEYRFGFDLEAKIRSGVDELKARVDGAQQAIAAASEPVRADADRILGAHAPLTVFAQDRANHGGPEASFGEGLRRYLDACASAGHRWWQDVPAAKESPAPLEGLRLAFQNAGSATFNFPAVLDYWFNRHARNLARTLLAAPKDFADMFGRMKNLDAFFGHAPVKLGDLRLFIVKGEGSLPDRVLVREGDTLLGYFRVATQETEQTQKLLFWTRKYSTYAATLVPGEAPHHHAAEPLFQTENQIFEHEQELKRAELGFVGDLRSVEVPPYLGGIGSVVCIGAELVALPTALRKSDNQLITVLSFGKDLGYAFQGGGEALETAFAAASDQLGRARLLLTRDGQALAAAADALQKAKNPAEHALAMGQYGAALDAQTMDTEMTKGFFVRLLDRFHGAGALAGDVAKVGERVAVPLDIVLSAREGFLMLFDPGSESNRAFKEGHDAQAWVLRAKGAILLGGAAGATAFGTLAAIGAGELALAAFLGPAGMILAAVAVGAILCDVIASMLAPEQTALQPLLDHCESAIEHQIPEKGTSATVTQLQKLQGDVKRLALA